MKLSAHRAALPGNVVMITGSAFLPAPAYRQEGGASSRLARDQEKFKSFRLHLTPFSGEYYNDSQETEELEVPRAQRGASRQ